MFRLFFNIFPVLTSFNFTKRLCFGVTDNEFNNNNNNNDQFDETLDNAIDNSKKRYFQKWSTENDGDNFEKVYSQFRRLIDLPTVLFTIILVQLISFVLVLNIEECSPLVLFSWWRNKIS